MKSYRQIGNVWDPEDEKRMVDLANAKPAPTMKTIEEPGAEGGMNEPLGKISHKSRPFDKPPKPVQ